MHFVSQRRRTTTTSRHVSASWFLSLNRILTHRSSADQYRPLCVRLLVFDRIFKVLTRFPSHTVGPRVYPGCGLVRRGMQARTELFSHLSRNVTDFFCCTRISNYRKRSVRYCRGAFYHNENQLTHFSFRRERQLQLAPRSATPPHRNWLLKTASMSIVCYANNCTRHMQLVPPAS